MPGYAYQAGPQLPRGEIVQGVKPADSEVRARGRERQQGYVGYDRGVIELGSGAEHERGAVHADPFVAPPAFTKQPSPDAGPGTEVGDHSALMRVAEPAEFGQYPAVPGFFREMPEDWLVFLGK